MTFGKYGHFERNEVGEMDERWIENVRPSPLFFAKITSPIVEKEVYIMSSYYKAKAYEKAFMEMSEMIMKMDHIRFELKFESGKEIDGLREARNALIYARKNIILEQMKES